MKTIIVDSSEFYLKQLESELSEYRHIEMLSVFTSAAQALSYASQQAVDLAYISIGLPDYSGSELARQLRNLNREIIIILLSDSCADMASAAQVDADCFLLRPFTRSSVESSVFRACLLSARQRKRVYVRAFGSFGVFVDGAPLRFSSSKAQELFAYLIDRAGNVVDTREGFSVLWEDRCFSSSSASYYRKVLSRMMKTLEDAGVADIVQCFTRGRAVNKNAVECDYYSYLAGDRKTIKEWNGEYMTSYSWAETTLGRLVDNRKQFYSGL